MIRSQLDAYSGTEPIWGFVAQLGAERFSGSAVVGQDPRVRLWVADGSVYLAERDGDASIEDRLVDAGVLSPEQLARGAVQVGATRSLARLFTRDPSIDRDAVELAIELANERVLDEVGARPVVRHELHPLRHHPSGLHQWAPPAAAPVYVAPDENPFALDHQPAVEPAVEPAIEPAFEPAIERAPVDATPSFEEMSEFERQFSLEPATSETAPQVTAPHAELHERPLATEPDTPALWWRRGASPTDDDEPDVPLFQPLSVPALLLPPLVDFAAPPAEAIGHIGADTETPIDQTFAALDVTPFPLPEASVVHWAETSTPGPSIETFPGGATDLAPVDELPALPTLGALKPWDPDAAAAARATMTSQVPGHGVDPTAALAGLELPKLASSPMSVEIPMTAAGSPYDVDPEALAAALVDAPRLPPSRWASKSTEVEADAAAADAVAGAVATDTHLDITPDHGEEVDEAEPSLAESLAEAGLTAPDEPAPSWSPQATGLVAVEIWEMVDGLLESEQSNELHDATSAGSDRRGGRGWLRGKKE